MFNILGTILVFLLGVIFALILLAIILAIGTFMILIGVVLYSKLRGKENLVTKFWDDICN